MRLKTFAIIATFLAITWPLSIAHSAERKKESWGASCPEVIDTTPQLPLPSTLNLIFTGNGQDYRRLENGGVEVVTKSAPVIGCYINEENIVGTANSPGWQIGALNRDATGFYFVNSAGITWRLTLDASQEFFLTEPGSVYYASGNQFKLSKNLPVPKDCKMEDQFMGNLRIGFPRNIMAVPPLGKSRNLIIFVDFPDAPFSGDPQAEVENVLSPALTQNYFEVSSNGRLSPGFELFPKVIRIKSPEKSFAPNAEGRFNVNGVMVDHQLAREAINSAAAFEPLNKYSSITVFAPTAKSLGYYGSAYLGFHIYVSGKYIENVQLVGGSIGTVASAVPSWRVFAHEYGHLLGMYDYYIPGTGNSGKSPGPFDLMGNTIGYSLTTLGYQRWVQGWLDDADVHCDLGSASAKSFELSPLNSTSGKRLYAKPLSGSEVLVAEYRSDGKFDVLGINQGILLYKVNTLIASGRGPISIQQSLEDKPVSFQNDVERYSTATLKSGESLEFEEYIYYAESVSPAKSQLVVIPKQDFAAFILAKNSQPTESPPVLIDPQATPTATIKPAITQVKKSVVCKKGKLLKKITGKNPKCPTGWVKK